MVPSSEKRGDRDVPCPPPNPPRRRRRLSFRNYRPDLSLPAWQLLRRRINHNSRDTIARRLYLSFDRAGPYYTRKLLRASRKIARRNMSDAKLISTRPAVGVSHICHGRDPVFPVNYALAMPLREISKRSRTGPIL